MPAKATIALSLLLCGSLLSQEAAKPAQAIDPATAKEKIKQTGPSEFEVGGIKINARTREVRVPTKVQIKKAPIEYMLVTETGKTHESVLVTKVTPTDFQLAMLLANYQPGTDGLANKDLPSDIRPLPPLTPKTPGAHRLTCIVEWKTKDGLKRAPLSEWALNINTRNPPPDLGTWIFNGSRFDKDGFRAEQEGSLIAIWLDGNAIINSPAQGNWDDVLWISNPEAIPDEGTEVTLIIAPPAEDNADAQTTR